MLETIILVMAAMTFVLWLLYLVADSHKKQLTELKSDILHVDREYQRLAEHVNVNVEESNKNAEDIDEAFKLIFDELGVEYVPEAEVTTVEPAHLKKKKGAKKRR